MLNARLDRLTDYPFQRLATLLGGAAGPDATVMSIGEPQHAPPALLSETLAASAGLWGKYPPINGTPAFRASVAGWLNRRFGATLDPETQVLPVAGTREALYLIAQLACGPRPDGKTPVVLLPNPFYQVYSGAAVMAGAEPYFLPATPDNGFLPDFSAVPEDVLARTALAYICTPANPPGSVASLDYLKNLVLLARRHDFLLAADECYSEIYDTEAPAGTLQACDALGGGYDNVVVFHSLSKRSSAPGLRSGFVAGDREAIAKFQHLRSYGGAVLPLPIVAASAALWADEAHVEENRALYRAKIDIAERIIGNRFGFYRPAGGFFLWLDVGDGEQAAKALWEQAKIRVLPGRYLARTDEAGVNPGDAYIRVALVHDLETTERAIARLSEVLG